MRGEGEKKREFDLFISIFIKGNLRVLRKRNLERSKRNRGKKTWVVVFFCVTLGIF